MTSAVKIGTRGSQLALTQAGLVVDALRDANPGAQFETVVIRTGGDRDRSSSISSIGVGVFVKELEQALSSGAIDIAVHSLKDMTSTLDPGFTIAAVPYREDPRDVLVSRSGLPLSELPAGATIATGSTRRRALLLSKRPDLRVVQLRGNVPTRLSKMESADGPNAVVLAAAGLKRLGLADRVTEYLQCTDFVSAVGQGALAVETRADDQATLALARPLNDADTRTSVDAERAFLAAVGGGCLAPVSAHARVRKGHFTISAFAADPDGRTVLRAEGEGAPPDGVRIAEKLARDLLDRGAGDLIAAAVGDGFHDE